MNCSFSCLQLVCSDEVISVAGKNRQVFPCFSATDIIVPFVADKVLVLDSELAEDKVITSTTVDVFPVIFNPRICTGSCASSENVVTFSTT